MKKTVINIENGDEMIAFENICKRHEWLVEARYLNQTLTMDLYKYKHHEKNKDQWKIYSILVGSTFSLWRAAPLNNTTKDAQQFRDDAYDLLNVLMRDNAVTYTQDKKLEEWMAGYYLRNSYLRLNQIKKAIASLGIKDLRILDNERFKKLISTNPQKCWMELHILSRALFDGLSKTLRK
jgi:hypothetical protein